MLYRRGLAALPSALGRGRIADQQEGQLLAGRLLPLGSVAVLPHQRGLINHVGFRWSGAAELVGPGQLCHQCIEQKKCLAGEQCARRFVVQVFFIS